MASSKIITHRKSERENVYYKVQIFQYLKKISYNNVTIYSDISYNSIIKIKKMTMIDKYKTNIQENIIREKERVFYQATHVIYL